MARAIDELNEIGRKSIDYEEYFGDMELTEEEKKKRIALAEEFEKIFLFLFLVMTENQKEDYFNEVYEKYMTEALKFLKKEKPTAYIEQYARMTLDEIIDTTKENMGEEYYTSKDRAMLIAENEANSIGNYKQQVDAVRSGMKYKTWKTENDSRVRKTHREVNRKKIGIFEAFKVGDSEMMFPKDRSLGAAAEEIVNCRCVIEYSDE